MSGVVFDNQNEEPTIQSLCLVFVVLVNCLFILNWLYLFCKCMSEDYKFFKKITFILALVLCIRENIQTNNTESSIKKVTFQHQSEYPIKKLYKPKKNKKRKIGKRKLAKAQDHNKIPLFKTGNNELISPLSAERIEDLQLKRNLNEIHEIELEEFDHPVVILQQRDADKNIKMDPISVFKVFELEEDANLEEFRDFSIQENVKKHK